MGVAEDTTQGSHRDDVTMHTGSKRHRDTSGDGETVTCKEDVVALSTTISDSKVCVRGVSLANTLARRRVEGWTLSNCTISDLTGATLSDCTLEGCNLNRCSMSGVTLINCVFQSCNLSGVPDTGGATLVNVTLQECDTTATTLKGSVVSGVNTGLPYTDKTNRDLTCEEIEGHDISTWDVSGSRVEGCDLSTVQGLTVPHLSSLSAIRQSKLVGMSLVGIDLTDTDCTGSDFS
ncbi:hypothetical protein KIPB_016017, partial [Kipferlia bialata]|eukprot:g16017.t1